MAQLSFINASKLIDLLRSATVNGDLPVWVKAPDQLGLGSDRHGPHRFIDLPSEEICLSAVTPPEPSPEQSAPRPIAEFGPESRTRPSRATGKYRLDMLGHRIDCTSLKDLLARGLIAFEKHKPGTLDRLSRIKPRTKRIVARDRDQLFDQPELSDKYSERLSDYAEHLSEVWWFGTNNSGAETEAWLKRGCKAAGLQWGKDVIAAL